MQIFVIQLSACDVNVLGT